MGLAVEVVRGDLSVAQLRAEARRSSDNKRARRILAIAMVDVIRSIETRQWAQVSA